MADWSIGSRRPPRPEDGPFYLADLGLIVHGEVEIKTAPRKTKSFEKALKKHPSLGDELNRLCTTFTPECLSALSDALQTSVKGSVKRGPRKNGLSADLVMTIKSMLFAGKEPAVVARAISSKVPGTSPESRLKRAHREVRQWVGKRSTAQASIGVALAIWACAEAARQLDEEVNAGILDDARAQGMLEGRISEIKSRAILETGG